MKPKSHDAARVWQRVLSPEPAEQLSLQMLMRQLSQDIAYLKHRIKGGGDAATELLVREYTEQFHSLKGIALLTGSSLPREATGIADHSLRRCYDHALQRLGAYQLRTSDPFYGPVFRCLARQTEQHFLRITQLLGSRQIEI